MAPAAQTALTAQTAQTAQTAVRFCQALPRVTAAADAAAVVALVVDVLHDAAASQGLPDNARPRHPRTFNPRNTLTSEPSFLDSNGTL